jgi:hypothetical protein
MKHGSFVTKALGSFVIVMDIVCAFPGGVTARLVVTILMVWSRSASMDLDVLTVSAWIGSHRKPGWKCSTPGYVSQ